MKQEKRSRLERDGWTVAGTQEFLDLTDAEMVMIDLRVCLSRALRARRQQLRVSQVTFARRVGSSQSRVAKMEAGDPSVSLDLLIRSLVRSGSSPEEIGEVISSAGVVRSTG